MKIRLCVAGVALLLLSGCANTIGVRTVAAPAVPVHARAPAVRHEIAPAPVPAPMPAPAPAKRGWHLRLFH